jgi:SAM-dependent methyltransferase
VLDIGCGYGIYGYSLYTNRYNVQYVGIDVCYEYLLKAIARNWGFSSPIFIKKDITKGLPFDNEVFNYILLIQVIEHLSKDDALNVLKECYRVLKYKGIVILMTENNKFTRNGGLKFHMHEYMYDELINTVKQCGFNILNEFGLIYAHNVKQFIKHYGKSQLYKFLSTKMFKLLLGIGYPQESKYIVLDLIKG